MTRELYKMNIDMKNDFFILMQIKLVFTRKVLLLASF